jgi:hypothetical protein
MRNSKKLKKLTLCALATVICGAGQAVYAHTGIKDKAEEGKGLYTAFTITHGCNNNEGTETLLPVAAQTAVFPNNTDSQAFKIESDGSETSINLADHIEGANGGLPGLAPGMVQDKSIFKKQWEVTDATGNVRAIAFYNGKLDTTAVGLVPFRVTAPKFKADSCAKSLKVRIAIANYCNKSKNTDKNNRSDIWIGHTTPLFSDMDVLPHDSDTSPFWPTLTVERSSSNNPLPDSCEGGFDIAVQPSDADIDTYLPVQGYWPK